jgi:hypothetical protein
MLPEEANEKSEATSPMVFLTDRNNIIMATVGIVGFIIVVALAVALVRAYLEQLREERPRERPLTTPPPAPKGDPPPPPPLRE